MPFNINIIHMKNLCTDASNTTMYSNNYYPSPILIPSLVLQYPGRISNKGDYRLEFNATALSHTDIVQAIYKCALNGYGQEITNFLGRFV